MSNYALSLAMMIRNYERQGQPAIYLIPLYAELVKATSNRYYRGE